LLQGRGGRLTHLLHTDGKQDALGFAILNRMNGLGWLPSILSEFLWLLGDTIQMN
jgi:hypothetical protein